jgi:uncharacterized phage protein (TIGR01671 family)
MREIKYRAWDKDTEQLRRVSMMDFPEWSVSTVELDMNDEVHDYYSTERNSFKNEETDRFLLMQYTGLKDKNGIEIYEGDIAVSKYHNRPPHVGVLEWDNDGADYNINDKFGMCLCGFGVGGVDYEVIGNIYENPELLNAKPTN